MANVFTMNWTDSWTLLGRTDVDSITSAREGEVKVGQRVQVAGPDLLKSIENTTARYVLIGLAEDIGVRANKGFDGAASGWKATLKAFLNRQSNDYFDGSEVLVLGSLDPKDLMDQAKTLDSSNNQDLERLRTLTAQIDDLVWPLIKEITAKGKTALVIGGGHNNSYGCLKGSSLGLQKPIGCVNIDPHADFRALEGRHSGNGFSYAYNEGHLNRYAVFGLHQGYNSAAMLDQMRVPNKLWYISYEDILFGKLPYLDHWRELWNQFDREKVGLEIDLDSISDFPTSASTLNGWTINEVRQMIHSLKSFRGQIPYLHLAESAPTVELHSESRVGKAMAQFLIDFIQTNAARH